jgi:hypothetical protein
VLGTAGTRIPVARPLPDEEQSLLEERRTATRLEAHPE